MKRRIRMLIAGGVGTILLAAALLALTVGGAAGKGGVTAKKPKPHGALAPKGSVEFFVTATEFEGESSISGDEKVPTPTADPEDLSDGYEYKAPGKANPKEPDEFKVEAYGFSPGFMAVHQGDTVALRIFVVGGVHKVWVEAPNGDEVFQVQKMFPAREYLKVFKASQPGIYNLKCDNHEPTMTARILVLPAKA